MAKKGIRRETRRVRVESDGSIWNTRITDAETGEEITPVYRVVWEADASKNGQLSTIHLDAYMASAILEGDAEIVYHDQLIELNDRLRGDIANIKVKLDDSFRSRDDVYTERNKCIALIVRMALALGYKAGIGKDPECEAYWQNVIYVDLPSGQVSWHIPADELSFFDFLPTYEGTWDGHSSEEKYQRVLRPGF